MKSKIKKYLMVAILTVGMLSSTSISAVAFTGNEGQAASPITEEQEEAVEPEEGVTQGRVQGGPFSIPGNGQLVDDIEDDDTKQFLTIQTKKGNTFFLVLDRSNNSENVYMLSMIDENDLVEFIEQEEDDPETVHPPAIIPEIEIPPAPTESESEKEPEEKKGGIGAGVLIAIILFIACSIGGYYYYKVLKLRQDDDSEESEDLEFYDGGAYINEDHDYSGEKRDNI